MPWPAGPAHPPMTETPPRPPFKDLDARLKAARDRQVEARGGKRQGGRFQASGLGMAVKIGVEMVSALIVGVGIGWALDLWLGTGPWLMVVFFFLGAAAGVLNVYRSTAGMGAGDGDGSRDDGSSGPDSEGR